MRRAAGKLQQRFGRDQHFIRIAGHAWPAEIANTINNFHRACSAVGQIAAVEDQIGRGLPQVREHGLKCREVAVNVRYDCQPHS